MKKPIFKFLVAFAPLVCSCNTTPNHLTPFKEFWSSGYKLNFQPLIRCEYDINSESVFSGRWGAFDISKLIEDITITKKVEGSSLNPDVIDFYCTVTYTYIIGKDGKFDSRFAFYADIEDGTTMMSWMQADENLYLVKEDIVPICWKFEEIFNARKGA